jgi:hypothetical protein
LYFPPTNLRANNEVVLDESPEFFSLFVAWLFRRPEFVVTAGKFRAMQAGKLMKRECGKVVGNVAQIRNSDHGKRYRGFISQFLF